MPPVGRYVIALIVISDRITASRPGTPISALTGPLPPGLLRFLQGLLGIDGFGNGEMRLAVGEHEGNALTLADFELRHRAHVLATVIDCGPQDRRMRAGDRPQAAVANSRHPRDDTPVIKPQHKFHPHQNRSLPPDDDADEIRTIVTDRHEIDERDGPVRRLEFGLQDQRTFAIATPNRHDCPDRSDAPAPVFRAADEGREAGTRIEPRPAEPIHRAVAADKGRGFAIADQGVVFDPSRHGYLTRDCIRRLTMRTSAPAVRRRGASCGHSPARSAPGS